MLKKLAAVLLGVGLCLPFSCDVRPITGVWENLQGILFLGLPVLAAVAYVLHTLVPPLAAFHERNGRALHAILRVLYFLLAGAYLAYALTKNSDWPGLLSVAAALVVTGVLLIWQQGRGTKATRVPLLLLLCAGVPMMAYGVELLRTDLKVGAWLVIAGWVLGVLGETQVLKVQPTIAHSG
jgi:hypothetical protein